MTASRSTVTQGTSRQTRGILVEIAGGRGAPRRRGSREEHRRPGEAPRGSPVVSCSTCPGDLILFVSGLLAARRRQIGHKEGNLQAGLLQAGAVRPGPLVPGQGRHPALGRGFGLP